MDGYVHAGAQHFYPLKLKIFLVLAYQSALYIVVYVRPVLSGAERHQR
ncbi:DNA-binding protein [Yersinia pestis subsp. microtus bv. Caucasica]|nr:DNA binding protein [Yersinia pestis PY-06]EIR48195.1 DNA binding protein [Yersinia pestis PY-13]EIT17986.1 DNA binding protein [Yersinia pestis PY-92]OSZ84465.1 DNA-binding protein [Yersinia pestis subsp. microtus bv. Caucasica]PVF11591.1 DNA-binding protein [Yersinia pestis]